MRKIENIGLCLAFGDPFEREGMGALKQPLDGGILRFRRLAEEMSCDDLSMMISTAGYDRCSPLRPTVLRRVSLSEQLARYINQFEERWATNLVTRPVCWSTRNEVRTCIKTAQRMGASSKEQVSCFVASTPEHLPRVKLLLKLYAPKAWQIKIVKAPHTFTLTDKLLEIPKLIKDAYYALTILRRLRRFKKRIDKKIED